MRRQNLFCLCRLRLMNRYMPLNCYVKKMVVTLLRILVVNIFDWFWISSIRLCVHFTELPGGHRMGNITELGAVYIFKWWHVNWVILPVITSTQYCDEGKSWNFKAARMERRELSGCMLASTATSLIQVSPARAVEWCLRWFCQEEVSYTMIVL
jgi:predicted secreted protein